MKAEILKQANLTGKPGEKISDTLQVSGLLNSDGFFEVYKVYHSSWNTHLVIKSLKGPLCTNLQLCERFSDHCRGWIRLGLHPNIVCSHYLINIKGSPSLLIDFVDGDTLESWLSKRKVLSWKKILDLAVQCLDGLSYAHQKGQLHRDLKPSNCFITPSGQLKIKDFGIASALDAIREPAEDFLNRYDDTSLGVFSGGRAGSPAYMAPEVWEGTDEEIGPWTDIYSFGIMLYELCCQERPFKSATLNELKNLHLNENPRRPRVFSPDIPPALSDFILKCIEKDPKKRFFDCKQAREMLTDIFQQVAGGPYKRKQPKEEDLVADGLNNLAVALLDLGEYDKAAQCWEMALKNSPFHLQSTYNLSLFRFRTGTSGEEAIIQQMSDAVENSADPPLALFLNGQLLLEMDDYDSAVQTLMSVVAEDTAMAEAGRVLTIAQDLRVSSMRLLQTVHSVDPVGFESVCISGDGKKILSGAEVLRTGIHVLLLWEETTGQRLKTMKGHQDRILSVAFSGDNKLAISGSADKTARIWDLSNGHCIKVLQGHERKIRAVALDESGKTAITASSDRTVRVWDAETGKCIHTLEGHTDRVTAICHIEKSGWILSASRDKTIKLWDMKTGKNLKTFQGHNHTVTSIQVRGDLNLAVSGSLDGNIRIWDLKTGLGRGTFEGHQSGVTSVYFTPCGRFILSGGQDRIIKLWDVETGRCIHNYRGQKGEILHIGSVRKSWYAITLRSEDTCELWELSPEIVPYRAPLFLCRAVSEIDMAASGDKLHRDIVEKIKEALSNGDFAYACEIIQKARMEPELARNETLLNYWTWLYQKLTKTGLSDIWECAVLKGHSEPVKSLAIGDNCKNLLSGSADKTLRYWDIESGRCLQVFRGHQGEVTAVALGARNYYALSGSTDKTIKLWEVLSGACIRTFEGHADTITDLCLSRDGRFAISASGGDESSIKIWDVSTGKLLRTLKTKGNGVYSISPSLDGRFLISGGAGKSMILWDLVSGKEIKTFHGNEGSVTKVILSMDGRFAFSGSGEGVEGKRDKIIQWDVTVGKSRRVYTGHNGGIHALNVTGDNRFLFSGGGDRQIIVWDTSTGRRVKTLPDMGEKITDLALSKDSRYLVSSGADNSIKIWFIDWSLNQENPGTLWDDSAKPFLDAFLTLQTPYVTHVPIGGHPTDEEISMVLARKGDPVWSLEDFEELMQNLSCAGYGWLQPSIVRRKLFHLQKQRKLSSPSRTSFNNWQQKLKAPVVKKSSPLTHLPGLIPHKGKPRPSLTAGIRPHAPVSPPVSPVIEKDEKISATPVNLPVESKKEITPDRTTSIHPRREKPRVKIREAHERPLIKQESASKEPAPPVRQEPVQAGPNPSLPSALPTNILVEDGSEEQNTPFLTKEHVTVRTGKERKPPAGGSHEKALRSVSVSPRGRYMFTGGNEVKGKLWNFSEGAFIRDLEGHEDIIYSSSFSFDGSRIATGSGDKTVNLWETATGRCRHTFSGHRKGVFCVSFSRDGRFIFSGSEDRTIKMWEVSSGRCIRTLPGHFGWVLSITPSADDRLLISASQDRTVKIWEIASGQCLNTLKGHSGVIRSADVSADGRIITGSRDGTVRLWDLKSGKQLKTFKGHGKSINSVHFLCDDRFIVSGAGEFFEPGEVKIWDTITGRCIETIPDKAGVTSVVSSPDGGFLIWVTAEPSIQIRPLNWEMADKSNIWTDEALPWIENFLTLHTSCQDAIPEGSSPKDIDITRALFKTGPARFTDQDEEDLFRVLGRAGFGWMEKSMVKEKLHKMSEEWNGPPPLPAPVSE